jgi:hypothetical protein
MLQYFEEYYNTVQEKLQPKNGREAEPKRCTFWFSEFRALPQTPAKRTQEFREAAGTEAEPKRCAFWFSEFGAKPQTPPGSPGVSLRETPKAKAEGFRPRKG